jgi:hypothetical protein
MRWANFELSIFMASSHVRKGLRRSMLFQLKGHLACVEIAERLFSIQALTTISFVVVLVKFIFA